MRTACALALAALALAGAARAATTPAAWARRADAICAEAERRTAIPPTNDLRLLAKHIRIYLARVDAERARLAALPRPAATAASIRRLLGARTRGIRVGRRAAVAFAARDESRGAVLLHAADAELARSSQIARTLGARACGRLT